MVQAVQQTKAVGYIRVSTEHQADNGVSLQAQQAKLEAYAALYDIPLVDTVVDAGASAKTLKRPGLQQALAMLTSGKGNALLVTKLDRLTRSVKDLGTLIERYFSRYTLMSVGDQVDTSTAAGRLVLNVLMSVAQWEREEIGERTKEALYHKRTLGEKTGGHVPYGYRLGVDGILLEPHEGEQALVQAIREARERGLTHRAIVAELVMKGFVTRKGTPLGLFQVQRIMRFNRIA